MKIVSQSSDQMSLRDGGLVEGIVLGIIFILVGGYWAYYLVATPGQSITAAWFPGIVIVVGLVFLFAKSSITVTIDKSQGRILFARKRVIGTKTNTYHVADVVRVELRRGSYSAPSNRRGVSAGGNQVLQSQTVIVFKDGTEMPLENRRSPRGGNNLMGAGVIMAGEGRELSVARQVASFLGVPFSEMSRDPGVTETSN